MAIPEVCGESGFGDERLKAEAVIEALTKKW
jgi:hypothetical protein